MDNNKPYIQQGFLQLSTDKGFPKGFKSGVGTLDRDPLVLYKDAADMFVNDRGLRNFFSDSNISIMRDHFTAGVEYGVWLEKQREKKPNLLKRLCKRLL